MKKLLFLIIVLSLVFVSVNADTFQTTTTIAKENVCNVVKDYMDKPTKGVLQVIPYDIWVTMNPSHSRNRGLAGGCIVPAGTEMWVLDKKITHHAGCNNPVVGYARVEYTNIQQQQQQQQQPVVLQQQNVVVRQNQNQTPAAIDKGFLYTMAGLNAGPGGFSQATQEQGALARTFVDAGAQVVSAGIIGFSMVQATKAIRPANVSAFAGAGAAVVTTSGTTPTAPPGGGAGGTPSFIAPPGGGGGGGSPL